MKHIKVQSDYSPDTYMKMVQTDDGDIVFKICGEGEMRIATSGGQFHGYKLVKIVKVLDAFMDAINMKDEELEDNSPCAGCTHRDGCGIMNFDTTGMSEEEQFIEHCVGCPCGDGCECNREQGCENYDDEDF